MFSNMNTISREKIITITLKWIRIIAEITVEDLRTRSSTYPLSKMTISRIERGCYPNIKEQHISLYYESIGLGSEGFEAIIKEAMNYESIFLAKNRIKLRISEHLDQWMNNL
jgi:hypothetical protein